MIRMRRVLVLFTLVAATLVLTPVHGLAQADTWAPVPADTTPPPGAPADTTTTITGTVSTPGSGLHPVKGARVTLLFNNGGKLFHHNQITTSDGTYHFNNVKAHTPGAVYKYVMSFDKEGFVSRTFRWDNPTHNPTGGPGQDGKFIMLEPGQPCPAGQFVFCGVGPTLFLTNNAAAPASVVFSETPPCPFGVVRHLGLDASPGGSAMPGDTFIPDGAFFHSLGSQGAFTIPANRQVVVEIWASSGAGTCSGQTADQPISWNLRFGEATIASGSFTVPAGTTTPTLFNSQGSTTGTFTIPAGGDLVLLVNCPQFPQIFYNSPTGQGRSTILIGTQ